MDLTTALAFLASAFFGTAVVLAKDVLPHERHGEAAYHGLTRSRECHPFPLCVACSTAICMHPLARTKLERLSR
jgi:hypothetical protein